MSAETFIALVILAALVLYALTGGADFGGGVWDLIATGPRADRQRAALADAIAPIWEANHVWLILVIVLIFSAFPPAFAIMMTALNAPMMLILVGIVLRAAAFIFRKYSARTAAAHRRWSVVFGASSLLTPFLLGLCLGALGSGDIRVEDGVLVSGFTAGWTRPFALSCGVFAELLFAFLAATFMTAETREQPDLADDFRIRALLSGIALAPIAAAVFFIAMHDAPAIFDGLTQWWAPLLLLAASVFAIAALGLLWMRRFTAARLAAAGQVATILIGWGLAQYPHLVVPDVTFMETATAASTLRMISVTLGLGAVVLIPSFVYLFRVFKGGTSRGV